MSQLLLQIDEKVAELFIVVPPNPFIISCLWRKRGLNYWLWYLERQKRSNFHGACGACMLNWLSLSLVHFIHSFQKNSWDTNIKIYIKDLVWIWGRGKGNLFLILAWNRMITIIQLYICLKLWPRLLLSRSISTVCPTVRFAKVDMTLCAARGKSLGKCLVQALRIC